MKIYCLFWLLVLFCLPLSRVDADPLTPAVVALLTAAKKGDNAKIQTLLKQGVDVNAIDKGMGFTALMLASNGWANVMGGAVSPPHKQPKSQADIQSWQNALFKWRHGYFDIIQLLIERGADVKVKGTDGSTPLFHAAFGCDVQTLKLLLEHGADVNAKTSDGNSVLMNAALLPWPDSAAKVKLLLAWGADINAKNSKGETALSLAKQMQQAEVVKVLEAELRKREGRVTNRERS